MTNSEPIHPIHDADRPASMLDVRSFSLSRSFSWGAIAERSFANDQLSLSILPTNQLKLAWRSPNALRPDQKAPALIQFLVPESEILTNTPSAYKSQLITDFLCCAAGEAPEPLRTAFYQELRSRGYRVTMMENVTIAKDLLQTFNSNEASLKHCEIAWR